MGRMSSAPSDQTRCMYKDLGWTSGRQHTQCQSVQHHAWKHRGLEQRQTPEQVCCGRSAHHCGNAWPAVAARSVPVKPKDSTTGRYACRIQCFEGVCLVPHPGLEHRTQEAAGRKRCWLTINPQQPTTGEHEDAGSCWGHLQVEDGGAGALRLLEHQAALLVEHRVHAAQRLLGALHKHQNEVVSAPVQLRSLFTGGARRSLKAGRHVTLSKQAFSRRQRDVACLGFGV
jgi:hypothetical protein